MGRRNGEVALCRAADKISSSMVVTPLETCFLIKLYSKPSVERISGLDPVDHKLLSLDLKTGPFAPLISEILL